MRVMEETSVVSSHPGWGGLSRRPRGTNTNVGWDPDLDRLSADRGSDKGAAAGVAAAAHADGRGCMKMGLLLRLHWSRPGLRPPQVTERMGLGTPEGQQQGTDSALGAWEYRGFSHSSMPSAGLKGSQRFLMGKERGWPPGLMLFPLGDSKPCAQPQGGPTRPAALPCVREGLCPQSSPERQHRIRTEVASFLPQGRQLVGTEYSPDSTLCPLPSTWRQPLGLRLPRIRWVQERSNLKIGIVAEGPGPGRAD